METTKHPSEIWNIAFPIEEDNKSSLMFVSGVHGLIPKDSAPKHDNESTYHNQSDNTEITKKFSLEEKDRSMMELTISDCCSVRDDGSNINTDNVPGSYIISPVKFSDLSNQLPKKQNLDYLFSVKAADYFTGSQTAQSLFSGKSGVNNDTHISEEGALDILSSFQLQDGYSCSTPKEKHSYSDPSSKYAISPVTSWGVGGFNSRDACREAPDGGDKPANDGQVDPGQVQVILSQELSSANFSESFQAHANALATRLMMQKTSSSSSSDFIDKLSLIDVEKYGLDSLISIPSLGPPNADQAGEKLDISPIVETIENCSTDLKKNVHQSRDDGVCVIAKDEDIVTDIRSTYCSSEHLEMNVRENSFPSNKKSRIPKLVQRSANKSAQSSVSSNTPTIIQSSNGSQNDRSLSKSISQSRSISPDHLPSNMFSNPSTSVSSLASAQIKNVNQTSGVKIKNGLGRRCLSALALDSGMHTNLCDEKGKTNEPGGLLNRLSSVSMCSLPSSQKRANYTHVQSKVKQYIHNIKASETRRAAPSRSDTNSPCKTPTSSGPGNSIYLLNEDLLSQNNGALPDELQALVHQLEGASGDPQLLRTLFRVLMSERQTRSEHEHMLAAMQLSYDNLLAAHARSQNLIDELRLQATASHNGSRKRVYHPGFSSVYTSRASSPIHGQRRHSVTYGGHRTSSRGSGCLQELSFSQPNLIKETTCHVTGTNLGISLDESGSMYLFPTPFESNCAIALLRTDESVKSGPNLTNESEESSGLPRSHIINNSKYSPENFNDQPQTYSKDTSPISASTLPLNVSSPSVSSILKETNGNVQYVELKNRISLKQSPDLQISTCQLLNPLGHKKHNLIENALSNKGSAIPTSSAMSICSDSNSYGTLRAKLKDFAALLSCGALTKQETDDVWAGLMTTYTHLIGAVGGTETLSMGAAMRLLACKFGLIPPLVGTNGPSVTGTKTQQVTDTCLTSTSRMTYERDTKLLQTAQERRLDHGLAVPKWSDSLHTQDTGEVADSRDGFYRLERDGDEMFNQILVGKAVRTKAIDSSSVLQSNMPAVTALDAKNDGSKETDQSVEGTLSAVPNYFSSISAHDVSDNERVSESVQVPELDSIYTVNEDTSSLSAEDYSKYISVLKRLHWKLSRQENASKSKSKDTAKPNADYLSEIRSLNERIEQLCNERNGCSSESSTKLKPLVLHEADDSRTELSSMQKFEENSAMNDREERHEGHRDTSRQNISKTNLLTQEAFASNDSLSPVSAREKIELWRERLAASARDSETDGTSYSKTAAHNHFAQEKNCRSEGAFEAAQKNNSGILGAATKGDNDDGKPFTATSQWRYSIGETRTKDDGPSSKRFDLDSGCPISDKSFRHLPSPHINVRHEGRQKIPSFSEKSASDIDKVRRNVKCNDKSVCNTESDASLHDGFKMRPFVEEHYPRSHRPYKIVCGSPLNNDRHHPMHGIDQSISDDRSQTSVVTGNRKTYDKTVQETLLNLQRDVDLMKSKFLARTETSGETRNSVRHRRNLNDVSSPGKQLSRASRTPVRAVLAFPPSTSDSDAQSFVQEGHGGGVRRRTRRHEEVTTKRSQHLSGALHEVQLSPKEPPRSCKSCFNHPGYIGLPDSNHSRVSSSPRSTGKRKKRSHSCPRMVPGRSSRSTFVDNQPTCQCKPEPESGSPLFCRHPSLPLLSDTRSRCHLNGQYDATAPLSHREYPRHQLSSSTLQFLQRSSSCRDLPSSCSGMGCGSHWQDCIKGKTRTVSGVRNSKEINPVSLNNNAPPRKWNSDCDVNNVKSSKYKLANHSYKEYNVADHAKRCTCDICRSCSCGKSYKSFYDLCDNSKPCCGSSSSNNLWLSLDTATALADSVHARSRCLLVALRSRTTPLVETAVPDKGTSSPPVAHTDVSAAVAQVAEVACTDKLVCNCDAALVGSQKR